VELGESWELLVPLLVPEDGYSDPPVAELALTPKYEKTLCRQLGCDKSLLGSNVGADCSLLVSPLKVNVGPIDPDVELLVLELELELDARNKVQGTAICLPELEDVLEVPGVVADELEDELLPLPELLNERIAKSTFAELGFTMTS